MCMISYSPKKQKNIKSKLPYYFPVYKIMHLYCPQHTLFGKYDPPLRYGLNISEYSNSDNTKMHIPKNEFVPGFHAFLDKESAEEYRREYIAFPGVVIQCYAYKDWIVDIGQARTFNEYGTEAPTAVENSVKLSKLEIISFQKV